jgi:DUF1680 family protein
MGAMPGYIYARDKTGIYVNLFVGSQARIPFAGRTVRLKQTTDYPWNGDVKITMESTKAGEFDLHIRIPGWCEGGASPNALYQANHLPSSGAAHLKVNGKPVEHLDIIHGYAVLHRRWKSGDVVQMKLDMPIESVTAISSVEADKGRMALTRGPIVYCFEGADNGAGVQNLVIPPGAEFTPEFRSNLLGGVTVLCGTATAVFQTGKDQTTSMPFQVTATPYYANANRGTCPMQVWMPESQDNAKPQRQE